jgi:predicted RNase H-related nuclease YkuK (DUF458 family)
MTFRKFNGERVESFREYVKGYVDSKKNIEVMIATDSQNRGSRTVFSTVIALYDSGEDGHGHGAHCIFSRWTEPRYSRDRKIERLLKEVEASIDIGKELRDAGVTVKYIDIDINPNRKAGSNDAYQAAYGWVTGEGFECRYKTLGPLVTTMADWVVKK